MIVEDFLIQHRIEAIFIFFSIALGFVVYLHFFTKSERLKKEMDELSDPIYDDAEKYLEALDKLRMMKSEIPFYLKQYYRWSEEGLEENLNSQIKSDNYLKKFKKEYAEYKEKERLTQIEELFEFFKEKGSTQSIPIWAIKYNEEIIKSAKAKIHRQWDDEQQEKNHKEYLDRIEQETTEYIFKNEALPSRFHSYEEEKKEIYLQKFKDFETGKLEYIPSLEIDPDDEELLEEPFYEMKELSQEDKEKLVSRYGYKHHPFFNLDGTLGNNLIIRNPSKTESDYHFCLKHLIARIDASSSEIEYSIDGLRADVVFFFDDKKVAVEVETGSNNESQVNEKVKWLNMHFDFWIIVCPKKKRKLYTHLVDRKKSFCLTSKNAEEKIKELQHSFTAPLDI